MTEKLNIGMYMNILKLNRIMLCVCLLLCGTSLRAQQSDARKILDRTAEAFAKAGGVEISFTVQASGTSSTGTLRLKGDKFLLESEDAKTWFDGRTQWSYLASSDEVNVSEPTAEELQSINPYALISLYKQGYSLKLAKADNAALASLHKVVLTATDSKRDFRQVVLYITKDTYRPRRVEIRHRGGDSSVILIDGYHTGKNFPDAFFVFDKKTCPSAEVIDLR